MCTFTVVHSDSICGCKGVVGQLIVSTFCKGVAARVWLGGLLSAHYLLSAQCDEFAVSVQSGRTRSSQLELGQKSHGFPYVQVHFMVGSKNLPCELDCMHAISTISKDWDV
jgi:hypothetical protein